MMTIKGSIATLRYPLKTGSLFFILACFLLLTVARAAIEFVGTIGLVGGIVLGIFVLLWYARYLFFILEHTALGHSEPPLFEWEMVSPTERPRTLFQGVLIMTLIGVGELVLHYLGGAVFSVYAVIAVLYFPATVCVISVDQHIGRVFDPLRAFRLIGNLRHHYLTILAAIVLVSGVLALSFDYSDSIMLTNAVLFYTGVWLFHVIGRVLYANRDAIGLDAERAPERDREKANTEQLRAQNALLDEIFPISRIGKYTNAMRAIDEYLKRNDSPVDEQRLFDALMKWEDPYLGLKLGQRRLDRFVAGKNMVSALQLCDRCLAADKQFRPNGADTTIKIAEAAQTDGRSVMALALLSDFMQRFPDHPGELRALNLLIPVAAQRDDNKAFVRGLIQHYLETVPVERRSPEIEALIPLFDGDKN
jgi:hypothetical protein